jgi:hypothetical protein
VVSFILSSRAERGRAHRDYITRLSDSVREDIRKAVECGIAYFSSSDQLQRPALEAAVLLYESELRSGIASIRETCTLKRSDLWGKIDKRQAEFISALTGGSFGSKDAMRDIPRCKEIAGQGSTLRSELGKLRRAQLRESIADQWGRSVINVASAFFPIAAAIGGVISILSMLYAVGWFWMELL